MISTKLLKEREFPHPLRYSSPAVHGWSKSQSYIQLRPASHLSQNTAYQQIMVYLTSDLFAELVSGDAVMYDMLEEFAVIMDVVLEDEEHVDGSEL